MSKKQKEVVQKQFTKTVVEFARLAQRDTPEILSEHVAFGRPQAGDVTLDVCCGPGALTLALAPRVCFARGVDLTEAMLREAAASAREQGAQNVAFDCADAEALPYSDGAFDLVTCRYAFHHMTKPVLVLREMRRVAKAQGRLMLIDSLAPEIDSKFDLHNQIEKLRDPSHTATLRLTTLLEMFEGEGLEIERQAMRRRNRSFNVWMKRAGLSAQSKAYLQVRKLMEGSVERDRAGFAPKLKGDDIEIVHNEGMFLLGRKQEED